MRVANALGQHLVAERLQLVMDAADVSDAGIAQVGWEMLEGCMLGRYFPDTGLCLMGFYFAFAQEPPFLIMRHGLTDVEECDSMLESEYNAGFERCYDNLFADEAIMEFDSLVFAERRFVCSSIEQSFAEISGFSYDL